MTADGQLTARLQGAYRIEMTDDTRHRQLSTISAALKTPPVATSGVAVPVSLRLRRRLAALVAVATVLSPAAVAVAAETSVPGDALYPVKQITEDLRSVVDPTVAARHRLDEADAMHDRGFSDTDVERVLREADTAIVDAGDPPDLRSRWMEARDRMGMDHPLADTDTDIGTVPPTLDTPTRPGTGEMTDRGGDPVTGIMPNDDGAPDDRSPGDDTDQVRDTRNDEMTPGTDQGTMNEAPGGTSTNGGSIEGDQGTMNEAPGGTSTNGGSMEGDQGTTGGPDMSTDPGMDQDPTVGEDPGGTMGQDTGTTGGTDMGGNPGTSHDGGTGDGSGWDGNG